MKSSTVWKNEDLPLMRRKICTSPKHLQITHPFGTLQEKTEQLKILHKKIYVYPIEQIVEIR